LAWSLLVYCSAEKWFQLVPANFRKFQEKEFRKMDQVVRWPWAGVYWFTVPTGTS
jgi:hypothetical protein